MNLIYDNLIYELQKFGGISTYWYELTRRLLAEKGVSIKFIEASNASENVLRKELSIDPATIEISNRGGLLFERFQRVNLRNIIPGSIFHSSLYRVPQKKANVKKVATVHDFTHHLFYSKARAMLHNITKNKAIRESDIVIAVSENTKRDLLKYYPATDPSRVRVIYNGVSETFKEISRSRSPDVTPYLLYVGSREPYKNFNFALKLCARYKNFQLYIVGSLLGKEEAKLVHKYLGDRFKVFIGISISELNVLYNNAFSLIYPSNYEGFGIPLVEAMRAGCPFIAINNSSIPEVAGDAGVLLDRLDIDEAVYAIETIERNRNEVIQKGKVQSQKFSWDACYQETINVYKEL